MLCIIIKCEIYEKIDIFKYFIYYLKNGNTLKWYKYFMINKKISKWKINLFIYINQSFIICKIQ